MYFLNFLNVFRSLENPVNEESVMELSQYDSHFQQDNSSVLAHMLTNDIQ